MKNYILYKIVNDDEGLVVSSRMQVEIIKSALEHGHFALKKTKEEDYFIQQLDEKIQRHIDIESQVWKNFIHYRRKPSRCRRITLII